jgi:hypothetical protein
MTRWGAELFELWLSERRNSSPYHKQTEDLMKRLMIAGTIFSLVTAGLAIHAPAVQAAGTRKYHASTCLVKSGTATFNSDGQIGNLTGGDVVLWCPLISDPNVGLPGTNPGVMVGVYSNGCINGVVGPSAKVCVAPAAGGSVTCNGRAEPGTCIPGTSDLPPTIPLVGTNDYPFVEVTLHGAIAGSSNTFFGYRLITQ